MRWSATQYVRFEAERNRPAVDLLAHLPTSNVATAIDIGCGPGNSTELLRAQYPTAVVTGIDSSPEMVAAARQRLPDVQFGVSDIGAWRVTQPVDVIFANASLQWLPDHQQLFPELIANLAPGGCFAAQMPDNLDEPAHRLMREIAADGPWADKLAAAAGKRAPRRDAHWYYSVLQGVVSTMEIWRTTYHHQLAGGAADIVEWFKGTGLRPFLDPLAEHERVEFLARYQAAIDRVYPALADGSVLLPFPRLFIVASC
jgi:trans-aconitate 2-methyltransferase